MVRLRAVLVCETHEIVTNQDYFKCFSVLMVQKLPP